VRSIDPSERFAGEATRPGFPAALTSLLPTGAFLLFDHWLGLTVAMVAASLTTLALIVIRRRRRRGIGVLLPLSLAYVAVKAIAGLVTQSQVVYFGAGLVLSATLAIAVGATAFTSKPVASYLIPYVTPYEALTSENPIYRRIAAQVTVVWALADLGVTTWEAWHLTTSSASEFVLTRTVVAWPTMAVLIFFLIAYVRFRLDRHEWRLARTGPA
jgi:hypothetical protein